MTEDCRFTESFPLSIAFAGRCGHDRTLQRVRYFFRIFRKTQITQVFSLNQKSCHCHEKRCHCEPVRLSGVAIPPSFHSFSFIVVCIHVMIANQSADWFAMTGNLKQVLLTTFFQIPKLCPNCGKRADRSGQSALFGIIRHIRSG